MGKYVGIGLAVAVGIALAPYVWWALGATVAIAIAAVVFVGLLVAVDVLLGDFGEWFDKTAAGRFMAQPLHNSWRIIGSLRPIRRESRRPPP